MNIANVVLLNVEDPTEHVEGSIDVPRDESIEVNNMECD